MKLHRYYLEEIKKAIAPLQAVIREHAIIDQSIMFVLPRIDKKQEEALIQEDYDEILVTPLYGRDAVNYALEAIEDMYVLDNNISRRFVQKYPGLIPLNCSLDTVLPKVEALNHAKAAFKAEVQKIGDEEEKFRELHRNDNVGFITSMAYRKVYLFEGDYKAFYFNWSRRSRTKTQSKQDWLNDINAARHTVPVFADKHTWNALIDKEVNDVQRCSAEKLVSRRPIKLRPECTWRRMDDKMQTDSAGLPFLLCGTSLLPKVTLLGNYTRKPVVSKGKLNELVVPRLNLTIKA
ncbi:MAG: hypothetical protein JXQ95_06480 [Alteromonas stellipolaris]|uniref:DNA replication terminus site-binding protein n=1 Tax=Alteromonas stellipolaris TaxID=233316 RepID=UPI003B8ABA43